MIVLGIDPGTADTGYGVVQSAGSRLRALAVELPDREPHVRGHGFVRFALDVAAGTPCAELPRLAARLESRAPRDDFT